VRRLFFGSGDAGWFWLAAAPFGVYNSGLNDSGADRPVPLRCCRPHQLSAVCRCDWRGTGTSTRTRSVEICYMYMHTGLLVHPARPDADPKNSFVLNWFSTLCTLLLYQFWLLYVTNPSRFSPETLALYKSHTLTYLLLLTIVLHTFTVVSLKCLQYSVQVQQNAVGGDFINTHWVIRISPEGNLIRALQEQPY